MSYNNPPEGVFVPFSGGWRGCLLSDPPKISRFVRKNKKERLARLRERVSARTDGKCFYCLSVREDWTLEHLIPRSLGGTRNIQNMVRACGSCNVRRGNSPHIRKFMQFPTFEAMARNAELAIAAILRERAKP